ncbi:MAG: ribosome biogenesis GTPase Der [Patescibacteria group bacterium]
MSKKTPIVAIVGRANVGKSSLFNVLVGAKQAIVAREAGTTRDSITEIIDVNGKPAWLVDTAGLKNAEDEFEASIQDQIAQAADSADHILVMIEADRIIDDEDRRVAKTALKTKKPVTLVVNKIDRNQKAELSDFQKLGVKDIYTTSTTTRQGISELLNHLDVSLPLTEYNTDHSTIKIALLGRPNVGKSALFNALAKKQQAVVSDRAGTTRDVNKQTIRYHGKELQLMDTAGIRRSGKIEVGIERFSVIRSLRAIEDADICLLLTDVNEPATVLDQKIAGLIKDAGKGLVIIVSKWDTAEKDAFTRDKLAAKFRHQFDFVPWAPMIFTSSVSGQNVTKLFDLALQLHEARTKKIKTSRLNKWLASVIISHPPAGLKNTHPRINYVTQTDDATPTFKFFGSYMKYLHWGYKRHLERRLREEFGFEGTAIKMTFTEKHDERKSKGKKK